MTSIAPDANNFTPAAAHGRAVHRLAQLQADLIDTARTWALDEVGATVAHELNDPLTALLIYLREIEQVGEEQSTGDVLPATLWALVGKASTEAARVCAIVERMRTGAVPTPQAAVARKVIDAWTHIVPHDAWTHSIPHNNGNVQLPLAGAPPGHPLTPREREVLAQITAGASNKEGSHRLGISRRTFEMHRAHIMRKRGARNAADLVRIALAGAQP